MSVRVVARIRPLLKAESEEHVIVRAGLQLGSDPATSVTIPNPKNESEHFTFKFNSVYERETTQQELFDAEITPTVKHLFSGFDVTIFAYGVTGTGKTHTMRGGKTLAERGVIPRLLSTVYRKGRKIEKDSNGEKSVEVTLSYYEIYNDKVFDLFEPPEKRTLAGLPIRDHNGKSVIAGLTERPCTTLKDFEGLYDEANINRSTSATKLNAHSSRSHAILQVKVRQIFEDRTIVSTVSAIDLAGSEDNRRTGNDKIRLQESSAINKSLFSLAMCVEAISKGHSRIPYRESKMTRILSLGQNNGLTVMILNLAPDRSYHLDTLSSLNFANRTKKIEVREIENEPLFTGKLQSKTASVVSGSSFDRKPLRPISTAGNIMLKPIPSAKEKPAKSFSVFADRSSGGLKRAAESTYSSTSRPSKISRPNIIQPQAGGITRASIEELVNKMVDEKLAQQVLDHAGKQTAPALSDDIQRRLEALEERVEKKEDGGRAEGLQYLLMAKQHIVRGEESSALKMYRLAVPFFPDNQKLARKLLALEEKIRQKKEMNSVQPIASGRPLVSLNLQPKTIQKEEEESDGEYVDEAQRGFDNDYDSDVSFLSKPKAQARKTKVSKLKIFEDAFSSDELGRDLSPRTENLLRIINTRDLSQIRLLRGVGLKKAEAIVNSLCEMDDNEDGAQVTSLHQLGGLRGVGSKTVENMRSGLAV